MTDEHRMEQLSRAYVQAVAAVCGCTCAQPSPDYGTDLTLRLVRRQDGEWGEAGRPLSLQLKSTAGAEVTPAQVVYDLKVGAYNRLRRSTRTAPVLLVLFVLPADPAARLDHTEDRLALRGCAYWLSLRGMPARANAASVRVRIPRANQFTPAALERIMDAIRRNQNP